ncbi:MAG: Crp/Fnr family transcriptional regulator [Burkholderiales bacterium]|nr:Crp/Fnr family transcriptional regulator [Burkholderiales bacterium]MDR4518672.1 Crp/Fnr family transcriptional regulator [Nitrosomonas sp.]
MASLSPFVTRIEKLELLSPEEFEYAKNLIKTEKAIAAGRSIIEAGCLQKQIYFVLEGWAVKYKTLENGNRQIVNFALPGDIIGMFSPIFQHSEHTVESISTMKLGSFPAERLIDTFRDSPRLALVLAWMAGQDERILEEQIVRIGRRSAAKRMAHLFIELYRRLRLCGYTREQAVIFPVTQMLLSDALGLSHVHAHRVFRELEKHQLVERSPGRLILRNLDLLSSLANFDESYLEPKSLAKTSLTL